ncbi:MULTISPECIES: type II toxin-antitoxin system RelB/DinJ family antitoxin [Bifidobacterium]|jgi:addiction module RelB/DinJ family antitoxin|uniref:Translation repressor RelB n=1 Tax=Bifidobacterium tibiigranuli TaxID=2172043 RepID=A0A5N6RXN0_9BIFI|nr:type II toxin-antitoxin system RelB/DinJ family antitoxin [Bifidobacterium tibiigranuli]KAE8127075.1 translation repressor RelB [Bifidobacterium tibiigranuli]KAE8127728.1 translation repressor RelB [Bifidobacterium tibiigranuli]MCI1211564.1 type II toxin-antitoxin system RelB/DinJ family antitoxin [Bifidobacterium tibiigranuli]
MVSTKEKTTLSLDREIKQEGTEILNDMGLNLSTFVEMGLRQTIKDGRLPFVPSVSQTYGGSRIPAHDVRRRINELNAATPQSAHDYLASLSPEDERRLLEERDA